MLNHDDLRALYQEIRQSFTSSEFRDILRARLRVPLELVAPATADPGSQVFEVIRTAEHAGWTADLIRAMLDARPASLELARLYRAVGLAPEVIANPSDLTAPAHRSATAYPDFS